eukprot:7086558-Pyramimonas_sp.AAC.1
MVGFFVRLSSLQAARVVRLADGAHDVVNSLARGAKLLVLLNGGGCALVPSDWSCVANSDRRQ